MDIEVSGCKLKGLGNIPNNAEKSYQYLLVRFLLGTVTVSRGTITGKQTVDYSSLPAVIQTTPPSAALKDFLSGYSIGISQKLFIRVTSADNRRFYHEVLGEFLNFHLQSIQGRHTGAFVFLYRALEHISYSIPLLYAATQTDYHGTFNDLKNILNAAAEGELGLFKKFLRQGRFIDPIKLQVNQKISFASTSGHGKPHFDIANTRFDKFTSSDPISLELEIKLVDIPDFLITIRNRFFHFRTGDGKNNIKSTEMPDSDEFFSKINPIIFSFLAIVTLHTIASKYRA